MQRGGKFLAGVVMAALVGCTGDKGKLEIRSTAVPPSAVAKPVPARIAEARGQLALGNVALALESFRKASREDPSSTDGLAGMAACYDRMGRYDLSRRNYEAALALAPADTRLLAAFAASLELQGLKDEAVEVRREAAARATPLVAPAPLADPSRQVAMATPIAPVVMTAPTAPPLVPAAQPPRPPAPTPVAVASPRAIAPEPVRVAAAPRAAAPVAPAPVAAASVAPAPQPVKSVAQPAAPVAAPVAPVAKPALAAPARAPAVAVAMAAPAVAPAAPAVGSSVTVKLPPPRPAAASAVANAAPETPAPLVPPAPEPAVPPSPAVRPAPVAVAPPPPQRNASLGPRLERLSMGEIALVTTAAPVWRPTLVARTERSATVRFVPLRQASLQPVKVRLLNAARVNRLAARTRSWLVARGWRGMAIGDAPATRAHSLVLYPRGKRALAQRLSAQFGFAMAERASGSHVTVLLGRDAARIRALKPASA